MSGPVTYSSDGIVFVFYPVSATVPTPTTAYKATSTVDTPAETGETITYNKIITTTNSVGSLYTSTVSRTRTTVVANEHVASTDVDGDGDGDTYGYYTTTLGTSTTTFKHGTEMVTSTVYNVGVVTTTGNTTATGSVSTGTGTSSAVVGDTSGSVNGTVTLGNVSEESAGLGKAAKITIGVCASILVIFLAGLTFWFRRWRSKRRAKALSEKDGMNRGWDGREKPGRLVVDTSVGGRRRRGGGGGINSGGGSVEELRDPFAEDGDGEDDMEIVSALGTIRNNGSQGPSRSGTGSSWDTSGPVGSVTGSGMGLGAMTMVTSPVGMISPFPSSVGSPIGTSGGTYNPPYPVTINPGGGFLQPSQGLAHTRRVSEATLDTGLDSMTDTDDDVYAVDGSSLARTLTTESVGTQISRSTISARREMAAWGPFADSNAAIGRMGRASGSGSVARYSELDDDESIMARSGDAHVGGGQGQAWLPLEQVAGSSSGSGSGSGPSSYPTTSGSRTALSPVVTGSTGLTVPSYASQGLSRSHHDSRQLFAEPQGMSDDPFADSQTTYSTLPPPGRPHSISGRSDRSNSTNAVTEASFRPGDDSREGALPLHSRWRTPNTATVVARPTRVTYRWQELERTETRSSLASVETADTEMRSGETFVRHGDANTIGSSGVGGTVGVGGMVAYAPEAPGGKQRVVHLPPTYREVYGDDY